PDVTVMAKPRTIDRDARVTMKGVILVLPATSPLNKPTRQPTTKPARIPRKGPPLLKTSPIATLTSATIAPTERSIPAEKITSDCPHDANAITEIWRPIFVRFEKVKKAGESKAKTAITARITA